MIKKTVTFTDFNEETRTEDFYFHMSAEELFRFQAGTAGGMDKFIQNIVDAKDVPELVRLFTTLLDISYGVRTHTGGFKKSPEALEEFKSLPAYSAIFMDLATNDKSAAEFVNGLVPKDLAEKLSRPEEIVASRRREAL